jgi:hypothetical protein
MKNMLLGIGIGVAGTLLFGLGWISHGVANKSAVADTSSSETSAAHAPATPPGAAPAASTHAGMLAPNEWQEFRSARQAILQSNPDLNTEYKAIIQAMQDQQAKLEEAMVKADPKVAPIVAKLAALRQRNGGGAPGAAPR